MFDDIDDKDIEDSIKTAENTIKSNIDRGNPNNIGKGVWEKQVANDLKWIDDMFGKSSKAAKTLKMLPAITIGIDTIRGIKENVENKSGNQEIVSDAIIDISFGTISAVISAGLGGLIGSVTAPGVGAVASIVLGILFGWASEDLGFKGTSLKEFADKTVDFAINGIKKWFD